MMKKKTVIFAGILGMVGLLSMKGQQRAIDEEIDGLYRRPVSEWPKPTIDSGVNWKEFKSLPRLDTSYFSLMERPDVKLGKLLFLILFYQGAIRSLAAAVIILKLHGLII
ncbi:hypothetical protein OKW96_10740 [Sphingobacterium sp. KU25419]|nr:hypothetical protein OKW96_10740 [Sphingobacterium sp. KU25419]